MSCTPTKLGVGCVVDGCELGEGCLIGAYTIIAPGTRIGAGTSIGPFCAIGFASVLTDRSLTAGNVTIGSGNVIGSHVTIDAGMIEYGGTTRIGASNLILGHNHIGHDASIGDGCTLASAASVMGHAVIGDAAYLSTRVTVHPRVEVGAIAFVGGGSRVDIDVPPYVAASGWNARYRSLNRLGLLRHGCSPAAIRELYRFYASGGAGYDPTSDIASAEVARSHAFLASRPGLWKRFRIPSGVLAA